MRFALFLGCSIPARVPQYELSARTVLNRLGIETVDIREFKCCGNPARNTDKDAFLFMAVRNLALAEQQGLDMMVLCKCCFGSLKHAAHIMRQDADRQKAVQARLAEEGLAWKDTVDIRHFLSILHHDIGVAAIREKTVRPFKKLQIATHTGCHALRPSKITQFDNPVAPVLFDELVSATGAKSIDWPLKLECCGAPLLGVNDRLSLDLTARKMADARQAGADYLCVACPYCQIQFEQAAAAAPADTPEGALSSIVFPQLLGLAMGIDRSALGLEGHLIDINGMEPK